MVGRCRLEALSAIEVNVKSLEELVGDLFIQLGRWRGPVHSLGSWLAEAVGERLLTVAWVNHSPAPQINRYYCVLKCRLDLRLPANRPQPVQLSCSMPESCHPRRGDRQRAHCRWPSSSPDFIGRVFNAIRLSWVSAMWRGAPLRVHLLRVIEPPGQLLFNSQGRQAALSLL